MIMKSEIVERIKELREKGMGYKKIAKALNISLSTVQYWCNDKFREKVKERAKNYRKGTRSLKTRRE
jgi:orotate phosphoribosyltransferase-like protein